MATENITQLIKDCQSGDPQKQVAAIRALAQLEAFEAKSVLVHLLSSDPNKKVCSAAIYALNELEAVEAIPVLIHHLLSDPNSEVRSSAAFILRLLGEDQLQIYPMRHPYLQSDVKRVQDTIIDITGE